MKKKSTKKTIIVIRGKSNCGKTKTMIKVFNMLRSHSNSTVFIQERTPRSVLAAITIDKIRIGIEITKSSSGKLLKQNAIETFATTDKESEWFDPNLSKCSIIVCTSRTEGVTVNEIKRVARIHGYRTIWRSTYTTRDIRYGLINAIAAKEITSFIDEIMINKV